MAKRETQRSARARRGERACSEDTVRWDWTPGPTTWLQRRRRDLIG